MRAVEMQLEMVRRMFPPDFEAETEEKFIRGVAKAAEVPIEVKVLPEIEVLRHDDGFLSPLTIHRVEISGRADLQKIEILLEFLAKRDWRAADLERLRLDRDGNLFRFAARMRLPTFGYVKAYAWVPWRWIAAIEAGQELLDSYVRSVGEKGFEIANAR